MLLCGIHLLQLLRAGLADIGKLLLLLRIVEGSVEGGIGLLGLLVHREGDGLRARGRRGGRGKAVGGRWRPLEAVGNDEQRCEQE